MTRRLTLSEIENAFLPSKEIDSAERFAGRAREVEDAYYALIAQGSNIAVVGNRGIGKSSLARQIINIATGQNDLLEKLQLPSEERLDFLTVYHACGNSVANYQDLLERLLTTKSCLLDWVYDVPAARKEIDSLNPKIDFKLASASYTTATESSSSSAIQKHNIDTIFHNVLLAMTSANIAQNGILMVIDEFDQIKDPSGFAPFLKSIATNVPKVKFCIVGVAQDIQNLMKEHQSSDRLFAGSIVNLPPMDDHELEEIIHIAENKIHDNIKFENDAINKMISLAQGHPYMIHLVGKYALRMVYQNNRFSVTVEDINNALRTIAERSHEPVLEGRYKKAIASSSQREIVLKAMARAQNTDDEVPTLDAYKIALDEGVENASQYVGQLVTAEYGEEIVKVRERFYRFKDSLFHAYVCARPSLFSKNMIS